MASSAPMIEVLAEMPSVTINCMPMIAPATETATISSNDVGSKTDGCLPSSGA